MEPLSSAAGASGKVSGEMENSGHLGGTCHRLILPKIEACGLVLTVLLAVCGTLFLR
jgi:hypothetical protein